jgi:hypothetical protein
MPCQTSDGGLLGHDALAALGLAVDCRRRELVLLPPAEPRTSPAGASASAGSSRGSWQGTGESKAFYLY